MVAVAAVTVRHTRASEITNWKKKKLAIIIFASRTQHTELELAARTPMSDELEHTRA